MVERRKSDEGYRGRELANLGRCPGCGTVFTVHVALRDVFVPSALLSFVRLVERPSKEIIPGSESTESTRLMDS
jgi:hypothetical protein